MNPGCCRWCLDWENKYSSRPVRTAGERGAAVEFTDGEEDADVPRLIYHDVWHHRACNTSQASLPLSLSLTLIRTHLLYRSLLAMRVTLVLIKSGRCGGASCQCQPIHNAVWVWSSADGGKWKRQQCSMFPLCSLSQEDGKEVLFWPRLPKCHILYAVAECLSWK